MQQIALFTATPLWPLSRQTPGRTLRWKNCSFTINPAGGRFDGCVVFDAISSEITFACPPDRLFLVTGEPPSIKSYHEGFAAQFSAVVTCHTDLPHKRVILAQQGYPWFVGMNKNAADLGHAATALDAFVSEPPPEKTRLLSVVVSDKEVTAAHRHRRAFVAALQAHFGDELAIFGRGVRDIGDKSEALLPFKYHIAIENSSFYHYWTEKLADPLLCWTFPLYWGCPNVEEYFPAGSFRRINIYEASETIAVIEQLVKDDVYSTALPALTEARHRVLHVYNLFAVAEGLCGPPGASDAATVRLRPEQAFRDHWTRKIRHRVKRALPRKWRKKKATPLGALRD